MTAATMLIRSALITVGAVKRSVTVWSPPAGISTALQRQVGAAHRSGFTVHLRHPAREPVF